MQDAILLTSEQTYQAESTAIAGGVSIEMLMDRAGKSVADHVTQRFAPVPTLILCGPGNNGGDGFVTARYLKEQGWDVTIALFGGEKTHMRSATTFHAEKWKGDIVPFIPSSLKGKKLVIDAIFGIGLSRPIEGEIRKMMEAVIAEKLPTIAVDIPSGINSNTGEVMGTAIPAILTVSFIRKNPGHVLMPGKSYVGEVIEEPIGVVPSECTVCHPDTFENFPSLWGKHIKTHPQDVHKYQRGHAVIMGGSGGRTGATRLAAISSLRAGAGLSTVACTKEVFALYATSLLSVMTFPYQDINELRPLLHDPRVKSLLIGPGHGVNEHTKALTLEVLATHKRCVLDADAMTVFQDNPEQLFENIRNREKEVVITPHEGELQRLFQNAGDKLSRARTAAQQSGAIIVLKGNDTVIAHPDGRAVINTNASPALATAGTGDVLAGIITGLLASQPDAFYAVCLGVWLHAEAASKIGFGLIAEDIPGQLPSIWTRLISSGVLGGESGNCLP